MAIHGIGTNILIKYVSLIGLLILEDRKDCEKTRELILMHSRMSKGGQTFNFFKMIIVIIPGQLYGGQAHCNLTINYTSIGTRFVAQNRLNGLATKDSCCAL